MLKKILLTLVAVIAAFLAYVAIQPAVNTVTRSATIAAPAAKIFPHINNLKKWKAWSPWAKLDPNAKSTFEGPEAGTGAAMGWHGNSEVGKGRMTIVESKANEHIKIKLDFEEPFAGTNDVDLILAPDGDGTKVTWSMTGERPFLQRIICTIFNADKMVGDMYEKGLANLAGVVKG